MRPGGCIPRVVLRRIILGRMAGRGIQNLYRFHEETEGRGEDESQTTHALPLDILLQQGVLSDFNDKRVGSGPRHLILLEFR